MTFRRGLIPAALFGIAAALALALCAGVAAQDRGAPYAAPVFSSFNPDVSAIIDMIYHSDDAEHGIGHVAGEIAGFGHVHGHHEDGHHHGLDAGFNLRHLEVQFSADVDPYFKGSAIAAVDLEGAEMEVAEIEATCLPWGLKVKGGKFYSDFGYINAQHSHQWDFVDQPLVYSLILGPHGLNEKGLQVSWLAPAPFYLLAGLGALQGENEMMLAHLGEEPLAGHDGPRATVGWLKAAPSLSGGHGLQLGLFAASGKHQEAHDGNQDGAEDHWLDGDSQFWGGDAVYKFNSTAAYGQGDLTVQAEYCNRRKDLEIVAHDLAPHLVGKKRTDRQDGYYVQACYGFLPRWRAGVRWEQVGLTNRQALPDGSESEFESSSRASLMLDLSPSEFSRIRLQVNQGSYATEEGEESVFEIQGQWMVSIGAHGAHEF